MNTDPLNTCLVCGWEADKSINEQIQPDKPDEPDLIEYSEKMGLLLTNSILFCNPDSDGLFFVICNDVFSWGCADLEPIGTDEIDELFEHFKKDNVYGSIKWCIKKRQRAPQLPLLERMRKEGKSEEWIENLLKPPS